jgi:2-polyprenyl-3-methyl-5-hydroxy-6-metoxy-1,4-benzoquinol methylase
MTSILSKFKTAPFRTRIFLFLRWHLTPYEKIASYLPTSGRILDFGSGHGLLSAAIALRSPACEVIGIDHDVPRVELANSTMKDISNLEFATGTTADIAPRSGKYAGITLIDVLHYFDGTVQEHMLKQSYQALEDGGTLLMREVDSNQGMLSRWNRFYESISTRIGFTRSEQLQLTFRTRSEWERLLHAVGFDVRSERCSSRLFDDILYICKRR